MQVSVRVYMCRCATVMRYRLVFIYARERSWESLGVGVARRMTARAEDLWFEKAGGVSDMSLRRRMKRKGVQRGRERACACAFQGVLFV